MKKYLITGHSDKFHGTERISQITVGHWALSTCEDWETRFALDEARDFLRSRPVFQGRKLRVSSVWAVNLSKTDRKAIFAAKLTRGMMSDTESCGKSPIGKFGRVLTELSETLGHTRQHAGHLIAKGKKLEKEI